LRHKPTPPLTPQTTTGNPPLDKNHDSPSGVRAEIPEGDNSITAPARPPSSVSLKIPPEKVRSIDSPMVSKPGDAMFYHSGMSLCGCLSAGATGNRL
jgi:hypothetical protein